MITITNCQTRPDCERDKVAVKLPRVPIMGFNELKAKPGFWIRYENVDGHGFVGRVICRVTCDLQVWLEVAQLSLDASFVSLRWVDPATVTECRKVPPKSVLRWLTSRNWEPQQVHDDLHHGVSDTHDQIEASPDKRINYLRARWEESKPAFKARGQ